MDYLEAVSVARKLFWQENAAQIVIDLWGDEGAPAGKNGPYGVIPASADWKAWAGDGVHVAYRFDVDGVKPFTF